MATNKIIDLDGLSHFKAKLDLVLVGKADIEDVPTNTNELINGANFQNLTEVNALISSAISGITGFRYEVVNSLPSTGENGVIYLVPDASGSEGDSYSEYIWLSSTSKFELIGKTGEVDLTAYLKTADLNSNITYADDDDVDGLF